VEDAVKGVVCGMELILPAVKLAPAEGGRLSYQAGGAPPDADGAPGQEGPPAAPPRDTGKKSARASVGMGGLPSVLDAILRGEEGATCPAEAMGLAQGRGGVWVVERVVDAVLPTLSEPAGEHGLSTLELLRAVVATVVGLGAASDPSPKAQLVALQALAGMPLLMPPWVDRHGLSSEGEAEEGWVVDVGLWQADEQAEHRGGKAQEASKGGRKRRSEGGEEGGNDVEEGEEEGEEWDHSDPFRERVGRETRILRAGWAAVLAAGLTGAVLSAALELKARLVGTGRDVDALDALIGQLLERMVDLTGRVERCLAWLTPGRAEGSHRKDRPVLGEPVAVARARQRLRGALRALASGLGPALIPELVARGEEALGEVHVGFTEAEDGEQEGEEVVAGPGLRQLLMVRLLLRMAAGGAGRDTGLEGCRGEEPAVTPPVAACILRQLPRLNDLLGLLRRQDELYDEGTMAR
jgi:hypothetical protein